MKEIKKAKTIEKITISNEIIKSRRYYLNEVNYQKYDLEKHIENFLRWYVFIIRDKIDSIQEGKLKLKKIQNFLDKMAVWYEFKYSDLKIDNMFRSSNQNKLNNNLDFFDFKSFLDYFSDEEKDYLKDPSYPSIVYPFDTTYSSHFHLSKDGIIDDASEFFIPYNFSKNKTYKNINELENIQKEFLGISLVEALEKLKKMKVFLPKNSEIYKAISNYEMKKIFKEQLLNSVMYLIINRGDLEYGAKRGFLFAKEFNLDIEIPLMYGLGYSYNWVSDFKNFVNEYLKMGGRDDLVGFQNYFTTASKYNRLGIVSLREFINQELPNDDLDKDELKRMIIELLKSKLNNCSQDYEQLENNEKKIVKVKKG